jgi:hypothetical protein
MYAGFYLSPPEPSHGRFVELAAARERRHERRADSGEWCSHELLRNEK